MKTKLAFHIQGWTGWSPEQPEPKDLYFEIAEGETLSLTPKILEGLDNNLYAITVDVLNSNEVKISYKGLVIAKEDGTTSIMGVPRVGDVNVSSGQSVRLSTPTMDGGTGITIMFNSLN